MTWLTRAVQQQRRKPSPSPPFLSTFPRQNLTTIKISFKSHGTAVFLLNRSGRPLIGYPSGPQIQNVWFVSIQLTTALRELKPRAVAISFTSITRI